VRLGFRGGRDIAEKFLQAANAAQHALGRIGQPGIGHGFELRQPAANVRQMPGGVVRLQQAGAAPEIKNGAIENEVELAPRFARAGSVGMRDVGINEEKIAGTAGSDRSRAGFHATAAVEQIDEGVVAVGAWRFEGDAAAVPEITGQGHLANGRFRRRLKDEPRAGDAKGHYQNVHVLYQTINVHFRALMVNKNHDINPKCQSYLFRP